MGLNMSVPFTNNTLISVSGLFEVYKGDMSTSGSSVADTLSFNLLPSSSGSISVPFMKYLNPKDLGVSYQLYVTLTFTDPAYKFNMGSGTMKFTDAVKYAGSAPSSKTAQFPVNILTPMGQEIPGTMTVTGTFSTDTIQFAIDGPDQSQMSARAPVAAAASLTETPLADLYRSLRK
jgi:hypothetical protein